MVLWLRKQFWENCRKKTPGVARFTLQVQKHFKNRKNWQKKIIPIDAPMDIQIAIIITPTKLLADSPKKIRSIPNFFLLFFYPQTLFHRTSLRDTIWQPASVFPKWTRFCPPSVKTSIENEKFLRIFFSTSCSFGSVECCILTHADERFCRKDGKMSLKCHFFSFLVQKKVFLGLFFGTRLDNLLAIADKKTKFQASSPKTEKKIEVSSGKVFQFRKLIFL